MKLLKTVHANRAVYTTPPPSHGQVGRGSIAKTNPILKKIRTDGCTDGWTDQLTDRHSKFSRVRKLKVFLNKLTNNGGRRREEKSRKHWSLFTIFSH